MVINGFEPPYIWYVPFTQIRSQHNFQNINSSTQVYHSGLALLDSIVIGF